MDFYSRVERKARAVVRLFNGDASNAQAALVRDGSVSSAAWQTELVLANDSLVPFPALGGGVNPMATPAGPRSSADVKVTRSL